MLTNKRFIYQQSSKEIQQKISTQENSLDTEVDILEKNTKERFKFLQETIPQKENQDNKILLEAYYKLKQGEEVKLNLKSIGEVILFKTNNKEGVKTNKGTFTLPQISKFILELSK